MYAARLYQRTHRKRGIDPVGYQTRNIDTQKDIADIKTSVFEEPGQNSWQLFSRHGGVEILTDRRGPGTSNGRRTIHQTDGLPTQLLSVPRLPCAPSYVDAG